MTDQQVFDTVVKHLLTQNKRSADHTICLYRGPHGSKCAIGCLIPDELYQPWMELTQLIEIVVEVPAIEQYTGSNYELLSNLQCIHDCVSVKGWRESLVKLAKKKGLVFNDVIK
jgi:hypothetical protein